MEITIPFKYKPRSYQLPFWQAMDEQGFKKAVLVWHRRSGKDKSLMNFVASRMQERVGAYYYFFPTYNQGRKVLWEGRDKKGFKFTDHIPAVTRRRTDNTQMLIETKNGSIFQIVGTDRIDSIVGSNPVGCVFSEYALQDPQAWAFIRPILAENGGWAVFNFTPRGDNHGKRIYEMALADPLNWFCQKLTVKDTNVLSQTILDQELKEYIALYGEQGGLAYYNQEYMCDFNQPVMGSYYGGLVQTAEKEGRITVVPWEPTLTVDTFWDLGVGDATSITFVQRIGLERRIIDYYESSGEGLAHYRKVLSEKPYTYGVHWAPHDIQVRELGSGKSRLETAQAMGLNFQIVPNISIEDGIDAVRNVFPKLWFDKAKCARLLDALKQYHKEWDDDLKVFKDRPFHDWASNPADSFRYFAVGDRQVAPEPPKQTFDKWRIG